MKIKLIENDEFIHFPKIIIITQMKYSHLYIDFTNTDK